jgi:hypothetical protein
VSDTKPNLFVPTVDLRFVERDAFMGQRGGLILQQRYQNVISGEYEWRDVQVVKQETQS